MSTELSKNLVCIMIRNGPQIWVEKARAENMIAILASPNAPKFVKYEDRLINSADVVGIYTAGDMEDYTRLRNGGWKCNKGEWHDRGTKCACWTEEQQWKRKLIEEEFYIKHGFYPPK